MGKKVPLCASLIFFQGVVEMDWKLKDGVERGCDCDITAGVKKIVSSWAMREVQRSASPRKHGIRSRGVISAWGMFLQSATSARCP